jgi:hypothetical protein
LAYKFIERDKLMVAAFQHLNEVVKALHHLSSAMVLDDERHLELGMLLQVVEFPWVKVGDKVAVVVQGTSYKSMVEALWQVVQSQPEQRETH